MRCVIAEKIIAGNLPIYLFLFLDAPIFLVILSGISYHYWVLILHVRVHTHALSR